MSRRFEPRRATDVADLVRAYPLCWIVSGHGGDVRTTPLPLLPEPDASGGVGSFLGHFACANPHVAALQREPAATVLCMGPQGYVSPRLVSNPLWGPTWNYAVARFEVDVRFVPEENAAALERLAAALEGDAPDAWTPAHMRHRYDELARHIVAFRATVRRTAARFKLGQDENDATFDEIIDGLGDDPLAAWMRAARPD